MTRRITPLAACLVAVSILPQLVGAQAAQAAQAARRSETRGPNLALHLSGAGSNADDPEGRNSGRALGFRMGWGLTQLVTLYTQLDGASTERSTAGGSSLAHIDVGARFNFNAPTSPWRPYADVALSARIAAYRATPEDSVVRGRALTLGGGAQYYVTRNFAVDAGIKVSGGKFTEAAVGTEDLTVVDPAWVRTSRLNLGISWWPRRRS